MPTRPVFDAARDTDPLAHLVPAAVGGDKAAMRSLLGSLVPVVMRAARRMLGHDHPDTEDIAQLALAGLVERLPQFRGESSVAHFAERIAVYRALNCRRDAAVARRVVAKATEERQHNGDQPGGLVSPYAAAVARAERGLLLEALDTLSDAQAEALALHFLFDHTVAEIAAMTSAGEETVRSRLRLGKRALRATIYGDPRFRGLRDDDGPAATHRGEASR
jgi:RNA polymerase sigma-70 factor (ECF subfamily)